METATKSNMIVLLGETNVSKEQVNFEQIARKVCKEVGFDSKESGIDGNNCDIILAVEAQDANIANAVFESKDEADMGAGDQGLMFGYATDEWDVESLHPYSHFLANKICEEMAI